jgi:hypothetical protein
MSRKNSKLRGNTNPLVSAEDGRHRDDGRNRGNRRADDEGRDLETTP